MDVLSGHYLEALEAAYRENPESVPRAWRNLLAQTTADVALPHHEEGGFVQLDPLGLADPIWFRLHTSSTAWEIDHVPDAQQRAWLEERFRTHASSAYLSHHDVQRVFYSAYAFETFLHRQYPGAKRFGLDGCEMLLVALEGMLQHCSLNGVKGVIFGMSHRGRLCVLANLLHQPLQQIFQQFEGHSLYNLDETDSSGDVKYHAGYSSDRIIHDNNIHLSLIPNPSHLESVTPVVLGCVRAKQLHYGIKNAAIGVIMHGDAAFAGQGVVMESLQLARLSGYQTGGTIHVIIDNQIGFTTLPEDGRSTQFPTDIAKMMGIPVWHVQAHGDSTDILHAMEAALDYRQTFGSDVILRFVGYRRHGHNEGDEPGYTQPKMYRAVSEHPPIPMAIDENIRQSVDQTLEEAIQAAVQKPQHATPAWLGGAWQGIQPHLNLHPPSTGITSNTLNKIASALHTPPGDFTVHPKLTRWMESRRTNLEHGTHIDWATAEALAFGSLLCEGHHVRLSGQDVGRGTFTQRHAALFDYHTGQRWVGLQSLGAFELINSPLSEMAVLGFEHGFSTTSPHSLAIWEAQFGDFANGAQIIIDQFIASAQTKWLRMSGLVMLLPHGYEGQGPEHSSARTERFLQLSAENNWRVVNCTTPANYFHALRRQLQGSDRRPLIAITPKSLLRHKRCISSWLEFAEGTHFEPVLYDPFVPLHAAERIVLCHGKVYYDLLDQRDTDKAYNVAIVRLEQLYPFPQLDLPDGVELVWCQEEPHNMGVWPYLRTREEAVCQRMHYAGRPAASSPATGLASRHQSEQSNLLRQAIGGKIA